MNKIYNSIQKIHMDTDRKKTIQLNIIKEYEKAESNSIRRPKGISWKKAAAAALGVLILLGGSTAIAEAVFHFSQNKDFQAFWGLENEVNEKLEEEQVIQATMICDEHNGFKAEAEKVISTGTQCFVWLKITAPENMWPLEHPVSFRTNNISHQGKEIDGWSISFIYKDEPEDNSDGTSSPWDTIIWEPEKGITYMQYTLERAKEEKTWDNTTLQMKLSGLTCNDEVINEDNVWNLEIPVESSEKSSLVYDMQYSCPLTDKYARDSTKADEILITKVTVQPFSISLQFKEPEAWKQEEQIPDSNFVHGIIGNISGYEKKDGSVIPFKTEEGAYPLIHAVDDDTCEIYNMYNYMEPEDIVAVYLDGERIPLKK